MNIKLANLVKGFRSARGSVNAVADINLEIKEKEFFVLLGPSGCGKSTLLNLIAGLEKPTGGEIWFGDKLVASAEQRMYLTPRERNIAMVFQSYALYPHLSAYENIAFPLRIAGEGKESIRESVSKTASTLGIEDLLDARPSELSGGQRQRVAIARAIVRQPSIFLLDEPLSNLDALLRTSTRAELKKLQRTLGITTVYVTHDQVEAMSLGDRIALLRGGSLDQVGVPEDLFDRPANAFVGRFIGSPPMNLLKASFEEVGGVLWLIIGRSRLRLPDEKTRSVRESRQRECLLGVRPGDVHAAEGREDDSLAAWITQVEPLGGESLVHASVDDQKMSFLSKSGNGKKPQVGSSLQLSFDLARAHLFETGGRQKSLEF